MKTAILLSFSVHVGVILALLFLRNISYPFHHRVKLFQVQLVTLPARKVQPMNKAEKKNLSDGKSKPEIIEKKVDQIIPKSLKPEIKETEKTISSSNETIEGKNINLEVKDFPFAYYLYMLQNRIQQNWTAPYQNIDQTHESTIISFQILRDGSITNLSIDKSSGKSIWDRSAQRAIESLRQLPPLPEDYPEEILTVHVEFEVHR